MCRFVLLSLFLVAAFYAAAAEPRVVAEKKQGAAPLMRLLPEKSSLRIGKAALRVRVSGHWASCEWNVEVENGGESEKREIVTFTLPESARVLGFGVEGEKGVVTRALPLQDDQPEAVAETPSERGKGAGRRAEPKVVGCPVSVPPSEARRVIFRYAEPMNQDEEGIHVLELPRCAPGSLPGLVVDFQLMHEASPLPFDTPAGRVEFFRDGAASVGHLELEDAMLQSHLRLRFPASVPAAAVEEDNGIFYAVASWNIPEPPRSDLPTPEVIGLVWDVSASMRSCDRSKALAFLQEYLKRSRGKTGLVRVVVLRHEVESVREFPVVDGRSQELEAFLKSLACDGGTSDLRKAVAALRPVGLCFVYSDGEGTFGDVSAENPGVPTYALLSAGGAPIPSLARISAIPVDLSQGNAASQVDSLCRPPYRVRSIAIDGRDWPGVATTAWGESIEGSWCLLGTIPEGGHKVEAILTSGESLLVLEEEFHTDNALPGDMLKARYASLLAQQAELQPEVLPRRRAQDAIREQYQTVVPGYHWGIPEKSEETFPARVDAASLATELRAWHEDRFEKHPYGARVNDFWNRAAAALAHALEQKGSEEEGGEIATGKMPSWLRDEETAEAAVRSGKKHRTTAVENAPERLRRKVYLTPWKEKAPYLDELERAADPVRTYDQLCSRYARCPGFFIDCSYFFSRKDDHEMALRAISNLAEIEPDYLPLQTALAMRLLQLEEFDRARACLLNILARKEDAVQLYWLLAYLEGKCENWERAAEYLVRLVRVPGAAEGLVQNALVELNRLDAVARKAGRPLRSGLIDPAWVFPVDVDVRMVLLWDSFDSDIDLEVVEPGGERCDSEKEMSASGGLRSRDITLGLGAESFMIRRALPGDYEVSASVFGPRDRPMFAPVHLCLLTSRDYGRPEEGTTSSFFQLERRNGGVQLGRVRYSEDNQSAETPEAFPGDAE